MLTTGTTSPSEHQHAFVGVARLIADELSQPVRACDFALTGVAPVAKVQECHSATIESPACFGYDFDECRHVGTYMFGRGATERTGGRTGSFRVRRDEGPWAAGMPSLIAPTGASRRAPAGVPSGWVAKLHATPCHIHHRARGRKTFRPGESVADCRRWRRSSGQ